MQSKEGRERMEMLTKYKKELITGVTLALLLFVFFKYIFPLLSPFILSYLSVYAVYPLLYKLEEKCRIRKSFTMFFLISLMVFFLLGLIGIFVIKTGGNMGEYLPLVLEWKDRIFLVSGSVFLKDILPEFFKNTVSYVGKVFPVFAYIGVYLVATILMAKDFDGLMIRVRSIGILESFMNVVGRILRTSGIYIKAQFILFLIIGGACSVGFYLVGISSPVFLGILTGIMDALPFIGTAIILVPSSLLLFWEGEIGKGVIILIVYLICVLVRELLEPRLVGKGLGIFPVILLVSIYAGVKLFGISGIVKGPLAVVLYKNIWAQLFKKRKEQ